MSRVLSWNILMPGLPFLRNHLDKPDLRYDYVVKLLSEKSPDLIGLQETTPHFINKHLARDRFLSEEYHAIIYFNEEVEEHRFGNTILVKKSERYTIMNRGALTVADQNRVLYVRLLRDGKYTLFINVHLTSNSGRTESAAAACRRDELTDLFSWIEENRWENEEVIIVGDFNIQSKGETLELGDGYVDTHLFIRNRDGRRVEETFSWTDNPFVREIYPFTLVPTGALDRIVYSGDKELDTIEIVGNGGIFDDNLNGVGDYLPKTVPNVIDRVIKDIINLPFDLLNCMGYNRNPPDYLYPSDHFGLLLTLR